MEGIGQAPSAAWPASPRWPAAPLPQSPRCELYRVPTDLSGLPDLTADARARIVLVHGSLQVRVSGHAPLVANPCGLLLLNPGDRLTRVAIGGDDADAVALALDPAFAMQLARMAGLRVDAGGPVSRPFVAPWSRLSADGFLALRRLQRAAADPAQAEPHLTAWMQRVLHAAIQEWRRRPVPARTRFGVADAGRFDLAQAMAAYLDANWRRNVSLKELAHVFGLSSFHLLRAFRRAIGLTPHQYTLQLRLRRSLPLIESARGRLVDVAIALGFSSHGHFSTAFRASFGLTPAQYLGMRGAASR